MALHGLVRTLICLGGLLCLTVKPPGHGAEELQNSCAVRAKTSHGYVCGKVEKEASYALFRGVPYAKQPTGERRFKQLEPADPWKGNLNAFTEGPICPQYDRLYGNLMKPQGQSEACIHANIAIPMEYLPREDIEDSKRGMTPILVYIHGGGVASGSGDWDLNGPENFFSKRVIYISFNYRLNVFGFLSLNSTSIPGNQGLRDVVTFLQWVRENAKNFGGDPNNVTLMGQSVGGIFSQIMTFVPAAKGLFNRIIMLSTSALPTVLPYSPAYAAECAKNFLAQLNIDSTSDPEAIHKQLITLDIDTIFEAYKAVADDFGLAYFTPVVESKFEGVMQILDDYPDKLQKRGVGKEIPALMGFAINECAFFINRIKELNVVAGIAANPLRVLPNGVLFSENNFDNATLVADAKLIKDRYAGNADFTLDSYIPVCSDGNFVYTVVKTAQLKAAAGSRTYLYRFNYEGQYPVLKIGLNVSYTGAAHLEDLTYVLKPNHIASLDEKRYNNQPDQKMRDWLVDLFHNFIKCESPTCNPNSADWPAVVPGELSFQEIRVPGKYNHMKADSDFAQNYQLFDKIYDF